MMATVTWLCATIVWIEVLEFVDGRRIWEEPTQFRSFLFILALLPLLYFLFRKRMGRHLRLQDGRLAMRDLSRRDVAFAIGDIQDIRAVESAYHGTDVHLRLLTGKKERVPLGKVSPRDLAALMKRVREEIAMPSQ